MRSILEFFLTVLLTMPVYGFDDKKPVAENDYAECLIFQTIEVRLLENDFAYNDHPFKINLAVGAQYGQIILTDTSVIYTCGLVNISKYFNDSILYNIIDLENGLISDFAYVIIAITNNGFDRLSINKVSCKIFSYGMQFWQMAVDSMLNYEVPAGSGKSSIFNQTLWIGGLDTAGQLCLAAERYRQVGVDFYSGPVMDSLAYCKEQDVFWHRVWKLTAGEISYHNQHWHDPGYEPIENIAKWPGNGDSLLGQAKRLAPYVDLDNNGVYDPRLGDYPVIKGDQSIFVLNNDDRAFHGESGGRKIGAEVQTLYYAYEAENDSALCYTIFANQLIINRSAHTYHDLYAGHFLDFDLGYFLDDFLHCDTVLESAICYNGLATDGQGSETEYGPHPPAQSFTCLNYEMSGCVYFLSWNVPSAMQDPQDDLEYYNYLRGYWKDSTHFTYGGDGYGGELPVNYVFTGDPVTGTCWTELDSPLGPGDRRGLISSGPYDFSPGDTIRLDFALVFARDYSGDNLLSVALLKNRIQQVREFYVNSLAIEESSAEDFNLRIYPNPCNSMLFLSFNYSRPGRSLHYELIDVNGKIIKYGESRQACQFSINVSDLAPGIYCIRLLFDGVSMTRKFIRIQY